jgi:GTP-binding protein HflX
MLKDAIATRLRQKTTHGTIHLQAAQGRQRAKLFELGAVLNEAVLEDGGWTLELRMAEKDLRRFLKHENLDIEQMDPARDIAPAITAANE